MCLLTLKTTTPGREIAQMKKFKDGPPALREQEQAGHTVKRWGKDWGGNKCDGCIKTTKIISAVMTWFFKGRQYYKLSVRDTEASVLADMH